MLFLAICLTTIGLASCAGLDVVPLQSQADDNAARGYRYYQQAPFLFVRSDGKGGLTSEVIYLPDTNLKMSARPYAYLASNNATLTFNNGTLTQATVVGDETVVPIALVDALGKAASAAMLDQGVSPKTGNDATAPTPYLFKIIVHANSIELNGGPAVDENGAAATIKVIIPTPKGN